MLDEVLTPFYEKCDAARCEFGHIYTTPTYYPHENLELWRPATFLNEPTRTLAENFRIRSAGADSFKHNLPLSSPRLLSNEEFIVVRAKPRPVVMLIPESPISGIDTTGYRGKIWRPRCLVGQVFGLADTITGQAGFSPDFVSRMRKLEFPMLMFLLKQTALFPVDSMLRLDECQSVFTSQLTHSGFTLAGDVRKLLRSQLNYILTNEYGGDYAVYRELLLAT